jgi:polysaccharide biosynthesis transport protein
MGFISMEHMPKVEDDLDLKQIWVIIKKRKLFLFVFVLAITLVSVLYSFTANPVYEAKARVLVNLEKPDPVHLSNNLPDGFKAVEFFDTQVALIKSRSLIKNVIKQLKLTESPEFQSDDFVFLTDLGTWFKSLLMDLGLMDTSSESVEPDPYSLLTDEMLERMKVEQVQTGRVLEISFEGHSPPLVAEITNALTHEYIVKTLELYNASEGNAAGWINLKLRDLNIKLKDSQNKLRQFKEKRKFIEAKGGRDLVSKQWDEIYRELSKATSERLRLEAQIQELKVLRDDPLKLLLSQPFIFNTNLSELQKNYIDLNNELSSLLKSKTSQHPDVVLLTKKLQLLNQKIPSEVDNFLSSVTINFKAAVNQEKALARALEEQQKSIMKTDNDFQQFSFLKQEVELNKKLYNEISSRKKELEVTSNFNSSNISIVDLAEIPYSPVKPKKGLNIILAILLSSFGGLMLIFVQESQDNALETEADFDHNLPYSLWGSIAKTTNKKASFPFVHPIEFRSLKAQFLMKTKDSSNKIFLVTSPKPEEGKSFIACNLAVSLGNSGKKVLVVEGDLYNSKIASIFNIKGKPGYIDGMDDCNKIVYQTKFDNVWIAPSGRENQETKNPSSDVFFSDSFKFFLKEAAMRWDYIFIKSPPFLAMPEARMLEEYCHGVILVLTSGAHNPVSVQKIFNQFSNSVKSKQKTGNNGKPDTHEPTKLMGVVINNMDRKYKKIEYNYYQKSG